MLPNYGANLKRFLFQPMDSFLFREIKEEIISAVSNYAPQVTLNKLSVFPLDDYGAEGLQALKIVLIASLKEYEDLIFDVEVKIA
jgi:phage baseplate assembly protein W